MVFIFVPCWWTIYSSADPLLKSLCVISIFWPGINHPAVVPLCFVRHFCRLHPRRGWIFYLSLGLGSWSVFRPIWFWPHSYLVALFPQGDQPGTMAQKDQLSDDEVPLCGQKLHQWPKWPRLTGRPRSWSGSLRRSRVSRRKASIKKEERRGWGDRGLVENGKRRCSRLRMTSDEPL